MFENARITRPLRGSIGLLAIFVLLESHNPSLAQQGEEKSASATSAGPSHLSLHVFVDEPTDETKLAVQELGLPASWHDGGTKDRLVAIIVGGTDVKPEPLADVEPPTSLEGYRVAADTSGHLQLLGRTQHGLANGIYDARRALLVAGKQIRSPTALLSEGEHGPRFSQRAFYHFLTTWNLPRLSADTFTRDQWKVHLQRMRALNANQFYFDIWADQYYHPDYPQLHRNKVVYDRIRDACNYAHRLGIRTGVYIFPCQVPPSVYQAHPEARAVEATNYHGINMCPSRAWDRVIAFDTFLLRYFGKSLDDVVVEMQDPGSCVCELCCKQFPELVIRFVDTYRQVPSGPADRRIEVCTLHYHDWLEEPTFNSGVAFPIKDLRKRVFEKLPKGTTLFDIDNPTLDMGRGYGFKNSYFFFDLDPESGLENHQVYPIVKLRRIESQVGDSLRRGHVGIMAYRMMPFAQHVADYWLFRKCWDPGLDVDVAMTELGAEWNIRPSDRPKFVQAMHNLDAWKEESRFEPIEQANVALQQLVADNDASEFLVDLRDQVVVFTVLAEYKRDNPERIDQADFFPPNELVNEVRELMLDRRIFEAYTVYQHWINRSRAMIGQRIRWWLQTM